MVIRRALKKHNSDKGSARPHKSLMEAFKRVLDEPRNKGEEEVLQASEVAQAEAPYPFDLEVVVEHFKKVADNPWRPISR